MILWDHIDPAELTGYVRAALADREQNQFTLSRLLPSRPVNDLVYRFSRGGGGLTEAATFRTYDAESPLGSRPGVTRVQGELPPISRKIRLGEYDSLRLRNADGEIRDAVFNDAVRMATAIAARQELARGEALRTGKVVISENGVTATVDFGRAAGHTFNGGATIAVPWSTTASADPLGDVTAWVDTYVAANGVAPDEILISRAIAANLAKNTSLRNIAGTIIGAPTVLPIDTVNSIFSTYDLPTFTIYDAQVSVNGAATRVIPNTWAVMVSNSDELGATLYGTTAESLEPGYNLAGGEPGVVAGAYKTADPVAVWTKAAGIALPVLANPDLTFAAKVQ